MSAALSAAHIAAALGGMDVCVLDTIDSTNSEAKRLLPAKSGTFLIAAEQQTGGRGRQGKSFYSPHGSGVYMTLVVHPGSAIADAVSVTTRASVAVCRAIRTCTALSPKIKWVNDVYLGDKKVCGILVEAISDFAAGITKSLIIGVGVNVTTEAFPDLPQAGSLGAETLDRNALIAEIARELIAITADLRDASYLEDYRAWSMVLGQTITYTENGVTREALARAIDARGGLLVQHADGSEVLLQSGEITLRVT